MLFLSFWAQVLSLSHFTLKSKLFLQFQRMHQWNANTRAHHIMVVGTIWCRKQRLHEHLKTFKRMHDSKTPYSGPKQTQWHQRHKRASKRIGKKWNWSLCSTYQVTFDNGKLFNQMRQSSRHSPKREDCAWHFKNHQHGNRFKVRKRVKEWHNFSFNVVVCVFLLSILLHERNQFA